MLLLGFFLGVLQSPGFRSTFIKAHVYVAVAYWFISFLVEVFKRSRTKWFYISRFLLISILGLVVFAVVSFAGAFGGWCGYKVFGSVPSPGGKFLATTYTEPCGALDDDIYYSIKITRHFGFLPSFDTDLGDVVTTNTYPSDVKVVWVDENNLSIDWPSCASWNLVSAVNARGPVSVKFGNFYGRKDAIVGEWKSMDGDEILRFSDLRAWSQNLTVIEKGVESRAMWGGNADAIHISIRSEHAKNSTTVNTKCGSFIVPGSVDTKWKYRIDDDTLTLTSAGPGKAVVKKYARNDAASKWKPGDEARKAEAFLNSLAEKRN